MCLFQKQATSAEPPPRRLWVRAAPLQNEIALKSFEFQNDIGRTVGSTVRNTNSETNSSKNTPKRPRKSLSPLRPPEKLSPALLTVLHAQFQTSFTTRIRFNLQAQCRGGHANSGTVPLNSSTPRCGSGPKYRWRALPSTPPPP